MGKGFTLSKKSEEVAKSRYFMDGENWETCTQRAANILASCEMNRQSKIRDEFFDIIVNQYFIPGGRILRNAGRPRGSLFNCYHLPVGDSIDEIGQFIKDALILWSEGGGVGCNFSPLRPRGDAILGKGGTSSGLVSFIEAADSVSHTIESGGSRRAAAIAHVDITHPEVMDFIDAKIVHGRLSHFNISVSVNEDFLQKVEQNGDWTFKFKQKQYGTVKARDLWNKILKNMVECGEPGLLNWSNFSKNNSWYFEPVLGTNPCLTKETLVAVADGRGETSIGELAKEDKDVPVYSLNRETGKVEIKMMRRPRISGYKKKILKITFDDGSFVRCTENHKFIMKDQTIKEAKSLIVNDRLHHMRKQNEYRNYVSMNTPNNNQLEHRIMGEFIKGDKLNTQEIVHHKNLIRDDNRLENLQVMSHNDHNRLHVTGDDNPMRKWYSKLNHYEKNQYKITMSNSTSGEKNGRWMGWTFEKIDKELRNIITNKNGPVSVKEWKIYCEKYNIPYWSSEIFKNGYKSVDSYIKSVLSEFNFDYSPSMLGSYNRYLELIEKTDLNLVFGNEYGGMRVIKNCERCGKEFPTTWELRERAYCNRGCANKTKQNSYQSFENKQKITRQNQIDIYNKLKKKLNGTVLMKEWADECKKYKIPYRLRSKESENNYNKYCFSSFKELKETAANDFNYKIIKIEEDGYEDVYNGTVDDNHNFYISTNKTTKNGKNITHYINGLQCGETTLGPYGVCDLGSLVLPNFITSGNINTNWEKLKDVVKIAVRFLDNVIDVNKYALKEIDFNAHKSRRIGLGVIGLAEYLFMKKVRYGSEQAIRHTEAVLRAIRDAAYQASVELAVEKGAFPMFDPIQYGKASFIRKLPAELRMDIKKYGIRNCTCMALAPTGTISLLTNYSSSIEPVFSKALKRHDRISERTYIHPKYEELLKTGEPIPDWFVDSYDLEASDHFAIQAACQRFCDGAVSKTINLPTETTEEELSSLLLEYIRDLKGVTVYRDGCREGQILTKLSNEEIMQAIKQDRTDNNMQEAAVKCASGSCEL